VPLISNGELIGVINVHHKAQHPHYARRDRSHWFIGEGKLGRRHRQVQSWRSEPRARPAHGGAGGTGADHFARGLSRPHLCRPFEMVAETLDSPVCSIMLVDEDRREW